MNEMTNRSAAERYFKQTESLAKCVSQISDIRNSFRYISERMNDCGDPAFLLDEALIKLGEALASAIVYANEYMNDTKVDAAKNDF